MVKQNVLEIYTIYIQNRDHFLRMMVNDEHLPITRSGVGLEPKCDSIKLDEEKLMGFYLLVQMHYR